jgi:1-deoxy-D-xylulose-5-phosphate synthase
MDQLVHDIALQNMPVLIAVDRAGLNGEDGETHQGLLDMTWGRSIPGLVVCAPRDRVDLGFMISNWFERDIPVMIRYPKGEAPESIPRKGRAAQPASWLKAEILRPGTDVCLIGIGATVLPSLAAADMFAEKNREAPAVVDLRFASPIDWEAVDPLLASHSLVVVAEDGYINGGVGEAIASRTALRGYSCAVRIIGVGARYIAHATRGEQLIEQGITSDGIMTAVEDFYGRTFSGEAG